MYDEAISDLDFYSDHEITFDVFAREVVAIDFLEIQAKQGFQDYDLDEIIKRKIISSPEFQRSGDEVGLLAEFGDEFIHPYITLRLLMENPSNLEQELLWDYFDVVADGYVDEDTIYENLTDGERYLIVTEGSSDSFIIKRSLELLAPDISDFFYFVDMAENYPFTGTGNLYRFCQGLASIRIQNKVLVIFDNDTAGREKYELGLGLTLPENMKIVKLPDLPEFESFLCVGPNGETRENINGRAVAIENFLDLNQQDPIPPRIRWQSYNEKLDAYQGSLVDKDAHVKLFAELTKKNTGYDFSKLKFLVNFIYDQCVD
jgi:hypothetical protein